MEAVPVAPDDSSSNSGIVKSDDGNPPQEEGRSSPPPNCAICLGRCRNKSFTDSCLHQFCFKCLLTWSRVKTECPLCKQNFKSIIHNVKSNHQYEEYPVQQPQNEDRGPNLDINDIVNAARRFRYRTTLTLPRRETLAIQRFLMHYPLEAFVNDFPPRSAGSRERSRRSPADFRRTVYRHNLWARPLPDFTGRYRDCSPEFFRYNDSQIHRLVPWLNRELYYLLNENSGHITYVLGRIVELLPQHAIHSPQFRAALVCYFGERTDHFLHEFQVFASTPYDLTGYDRHVQYRTEARAPAVAEVLSSSDSESRDSDIVVVSSSHAAPAPAPAPASAPAPAPAAGSSRAPAPAAPRDPAVIPIETISHSDSDSDSSGVMVVGYIKPPHQRTPELVDLLGSDSDVVVHEPEPLPQLTAHELIARNNARDAAHRAAMDAAELEYQQHLAERKEALVRIQMSVPQESSDEGIWHSEPYPPPPLPPRCARRPRPHLDRDSSVARTPPFSSDDDSTDSSSDDRRRSRKRKPKRKSTRGADKRAPRQRRNRKKSEESQSESDKRRKGKSRNGRGVKSSTAVNVTETPLPSEPAALDQPGCSGTANGLKRKSAAPRRGSRESKRLKSVVKVMRRISDQNEGACSSKNGTGAANDSKKRSKTKLSAETRNGRRSYADRDSTTSSDDNIPLRLAMSRSYESDDSD